MEGDESRVTKEEGGGGGERREREREGEGEEGEMELSGFTGTHAGYE